jgi:hypothetical protein
MLMQLADLETFEIQAAAFVANGQAGAHVGAHGRFLRCFLFNGGFWPTAPVAASRGGSRLPLSNRMLAH